MNIVAGVPPDRDREPRGAGAISGDLVDAVIELGERPFDVSAFGSVSLHDCSRAYAIAALAERGLADWRWLVNDLAAAMDDAALEAAEDWLRAHGRALATAAHLPRWCPCGRWPDFGTACWYHGECRCVRWETVGANLSTTSYGRAELGYNTYGWRLDWRRWREEPPALRQGCPVHPDGPLPEEVLRRWSSYQPLVLGGERGWVRTS